VRFSNGKLCSPKQRKQVVVLFSVNTNNVTGGLKSCLDILREGYEQKLMKE